LVKMDAVHEQRQLRFGDYDFAMSANDDAQR
jgi:hypothetical protein